MGLAFEGIVGKAYAKTKTPAANLTLPEGADFEVMSTSTARSADYEIIYVYGKKYIIFSSGSNIEVLEYWEVRHPVFYNFPKNFPINSRILYVFNAFFIFLHRKKVANFVTILPNFL